MTLSCHFLASRQPDIVDHHAKRVPHLTINILRPASPTVAAGIVVNDFTYPSGVSITFWPFSGQLVARLRQSPPPSYSPSLGQLIPTGRTLASPPFTFSSNEHTSDHQARFHAFVLSMSICLTCSICVQPCSCPCPCPRPASRSQPTQLNNYTWAKLTQSNTP